MPNYKLGPATFFRLYIVGRSQRVVQCRDDPCWMESKPSSPAGSKNQLILYESWRLLPILIGKEQILQIDLSYKSREAMPDMSGDLLSTNPERSALMVSSFGQTKKDRENSARKRRGKEKTRRIGVCAPMHRISFLR